MYGVIVHRVRRFPQIKKNLGEADEHQICVNCPAIVVIAGWEREFDDNRARLFGTPAEAELDLKSGDIAFADLVAQGD